MQTVPSADQWRELAFELAKTEVSFGDKAQWDKMAPTYSHKPKRSGYISQLLEILDLQPSESVFDMGCGPGILSIPLAQAGHEVYAVDFSDGMLAELERAAAKAEVSGSVHAYKRSWQQDWTDLPVADVAISSRSMSTYDFADAVAKLESKARRRVVVTCAAGETPWLDAHLLHALGRNGDEVSFAATFTAFLNYLLQTGRFPEVAYITHPRTPSSSNPDELKAFLRKSAQVKPAEEDAFERFVCEHMVAADDGRVQMDYEQTVRWAVVSWSPRNAT